MDRVDTIKHCDEIGACGLSNFELRKPSSRISTSSSHNNGQESICNVCQEIVQEVKAVLEDTDEINDARQKLDTLCDYLKVVNVDQECRQQIDKYLDEAVAFVKSIDPLNYCRSLSLCDSRMTSMSKPNNQKSSSSVSNVFANFNKFGIETGVSIGAPVASNKDIMSTKQNDEFKTTRGPFCMLCKTVVKELFHFLKENRTEANIKYALDEICQIVYSDHDKIKECDQMIDTYTRELIEFLAAETDPDLICILLEQCTYHARPEETTPLPHDLKKLSSSDDIRIQDLTLGQFINRLEPIESFQTCIECKVFIKYLRNLIREPVTKEKIKSVLLEKLCNNLEDEELKRSCKRLIDNYADIFFKAVVEELNPETACIELQACPNKTQLPTESIVFDLLSLDTDEKSATEAKLENRQPCDACLALVIEFDSYMSTNTMSRDTQFLIDKFCVPMDDPIMCANIIERSAQQIIHHMIAMKEPYEICALEKYCRVV